MSAFTIDTAHADLRHAAAFLTRLPVRPPTEAEPGSLARAAWGFPLVGVVVGAIGAAALLLLDSLGLPQGLAALGGLVAVWLVTGGLHEDGLADTADGFGGGRDRASRLAIMRDSRIGSHGAVALIVSFLARTLALAAIGTADAAAAALIAAAALSRAAMVPAMAGLAPAQPDGLSVHAGRPATGTVVAALILGAVAAWLWLGFGAALLGLLVALAAALAVGGLAHRKIGGQTGDVLGAVAQTAEIAVLMALSAAG